MAGGVVYDGPSRIDGAPVLGIVTLDSGNVKTGAMAQLWIIRADMPPSEASRTGADASICGGCPHRGRLVDGVLVDRSCYVTLMHGPRAVWDAWMRGVYDVAGSPDAVARIGAGRKVRLGAYGDPAAIDPAVIHALCRDAAGWTGYTHQWRSRRLTADIQRYVMASVDSYRDWRAAESMGWGTFGVLPAGAPIPDGAVECANARTGVQCADCLECDGTSGRHIVIHAHGTGAGAVTRRALPVMA